MNVGSSLSWNMVVIVVDVAVVPSLSVLGCRCRTVIRFSEYIFIFSSKIKINLLSYRIDITNMYADNCI